jgi:hypothetical protein
MGRPVTARLPSHRLRHHARLPRPALSILNVVVRQNPATKCRMTSNRQTRNEEVFRPSGRETGNAFYWIVRALAQVRGPDFVWEIQGVIPSWVMTQASPVPSKLAGRRGRIGFTLCHVHHVTLLRTGCSPPAALHPVLPRRSSLRLQAGETFRLTGTFTPRCARFHRRTRDGGLNATPPSEPDWRISRIRLSS